MTKSLEPSRDALVALAALHRDDMHGVGCGDRDDHPIHLWTTSTQTTHVCPGLPAYPADLCPLCGWHVSSHGHSHGYRSDCPMGPPGPGLAKMSTESRRGCCLACFGVGRTRAGECSTCSGTGHSHLQALCASPQAPSPSEVHDYVSTACHHGLHERCRRTCKFCGVGCQCSCGHPDAASEPTGDLQREVDAASPDDAWLAGWRAHQSGAVCEHGYGPGDHHWESGFCVRDGEVQS